MKAIFRDRIDAGKKLAAQLKIEKGSWIHDWNNIVVLALPRGGVPVAYQVAKLLNVPLDIMVVRKVGLPGNPELAMGAVASGGIEIVNQQVVDISGISHAEFTQVAQRELTELERREHVFRQGKLPLELTKKHVILVDDGIATGSTMRAAIQALKKLHALSITVAIPTAAADTLTMLSSEVDKIVCLYSPEYFYAVGSAYGDFSQTTDEEVAELLKRANAAHCPNIHANL